MADITAEMTANVWQLTVAEGDTVEDGDVIAVLESMKMEIPVIADSAGTVQFHVKAGDAINEGDPIATITT